MDLLLSGTLESKHIHTETKARYQTAQVMAIFEPIFQLDE